MTKKLIGVAVVLLVGAGLFGVKLSIAPPVTLAATTSSIDVNQIARSAPTDLPSFDDRYQRHLGVLDVLNAP